MIGLGINVLARYYMAARTRPPRAKYAARATGAVSRTARPLPHSWMFVLRTFPGTGRR